MRTCRFALLVVALGSAVALGCGSTVDSGAAPTRGTDAADNSDTAPPPTDAGVPEDTGGGASSDADSGSAPMPVTYDAGPCRPNFASGVNVAWVKFAADVPGPNLGTFQTVFQNTRA